MKRIGSCRANDIVQKYTHSVTGIETIIFPKLSHFLFFALLGQNTQDDLDVLRQRCSTCIAHCPSFRNLYFDGAVQLEMP